jgi:hypothetical protein
VVHDRAVDAKRLAENVHWTVPSSVGFARFYPDGSPPCFSGVGVNPRTLH